jgi:hypothetical protein
MLLIVTLTAPERFEYLTVGVFETVAQCYFAATKINWEMPMPPNTEAICIRVTEDKLV